MFKKPKTQYVQLPIQPGLCLLSYPKPLLGSSLRLHLLKAYLQLSSSIHNYEKGIFASSFQDQMLSLNYRSQQQMAHHGTSLGNKKQLEVVLFLLIYILMPLVRTWLFEDKEQYFNL